MGEVTNISDLSKVAISICVGGFVGAACCYGYFKYTEKTPTSPSSNDIENGDVARLDKFRQEEEKRDKDIVQRIQSTKTSVGLFSPNEEIFKEQTNRTEIYYGAEAYDKVKKGYVIIVGLGGVGSAAAHVLLRSGVRHLRLIDPDVVTISSLNRNAVANRNDVGRSKGQVLADYFLKISPETKVEVFDTFFKEELAPKLLEGKPDVVIDCIDNRDSKVELMAYCKSHGIMMISAFGAGSANDPTKIKIADLKDSFGCVFGKTIRRYLRARGVTEGILVVFSTEANKKKLIKLTDDEIRIAMEDEVKRKVRISKLGAAMPIPSIFGTIMANSVLNILAGLPVIYEEENRVAAALVPAQRLLKVLVKEEVDRYHVSPKLTKENFSVEDMKTIVDAFEGKSAISGATNGNFRITRWRIEKPASMNNLIYVNQKDYDTHTSIPGDVDFFYPPPVVSRIDDILSSM